MQTKIFSLLILMGCFLFNASSQNITEKGIPLINNYSPANYGNKGKIWDIQIIHSGIVFFAADKGLLRFDGKNWDSFKGSKGFTRSIAAISDSVLFTGSDMDFGIWKKEWDRTWVYSSLYPFKEQIGEESEEFWGTYHIDGLVVFVSSQSIFIYNNQQLTKISSPGKILRSFENKGILYLSDSKEGLLKFENAGLKNVASFSGGESIEIVGIYEYKMKKYAVTKEKGIFEINNKKLLPTDNELSDLLKQAKVFSFSMLSNNLIAFGSILNGLYICDTEGNIIHHINRNKGLKSNTILSLHYSNHNQLWIGLDYGLAMIDFNHPYTYVFDQSGNFGTAYSAHLKNNIFYLGTNQGLYKTLWQNLDNQSPDFSFELINNTEGQVWEVTEVEDQLMIGHDKGLFALTKDEIQQIGNESGVWTILPYKEYLLAGTYNGVSVYQQNTGRWEFRKKIDFIAGSCNQLLIENDSILWIHIPTFGIIRTPMNDAFSASERIIFPENEFIGEDHHLSSDSSGILLKTDTYVYRFNERLQRFEEGTANTEPSQLRDGLPSVFNPSMINKNYIFYPVYNGFALKNLHSKHPLKIGDKKLVLLQIQAMNSNKTIRISNSQSIEWQMNNLLFSFIVPNSAEAVYQYRLDNDEWNDWSFNNQAMLLNVPQGKHELHIRAAIGDKIIDELTTAFKIGRPWYKSWYAYIVYGIVVLILLYTMYLWQSMRLRRQKKTMLLRQQSSLRDQAEKHRLEISRLEQERLQSENDTLKKQLKNKTIDLASKAKENEEKNKLLLDLKEKCINAQASPAKSASIWKEMHRMIESNIKYDDNTFDIQMNELHQEFFKKLKQLFPSLSNNDLRLCAYLKIGMNSKEIADIMNIQPSSSYISRSRLRKKLGLEPEENLYDYLNSL